MKSLIAFLIACCLSLTALAQTYYYVYPTITVSGTPTYPGNAVSGTGSFGGNTTVIPDFNWTLTATGNKISSLSTTLDVDEMNEDNGWSDKYGFVTGTTPCIKAIHAGNEGVSGGPLGIPLVLTITFPNPAKAYGWGFLLLDMDVDQVDIEATRPDGSSFTKSQINEWFKGVEDAFWEDEYVLPCWDATNATVVGSAYAGIPCTRRTQLFTGTDHEGAFAWFEPNALVKTLTFRYYSLRATAAPSFRLFLAASTVVTAAGITYNDFNSDNTFDGIATGTAGSQLYSYLTTSGGVVLDSAVVKTDGSFSFLPQSSSGSNTNYKILLTSTSAAIGSSNPAITLPAEWAAAGENTTITYAASNNDGNGAANQSFGLDVGNAGFTSLRFAVQQRPQTAVRTETIGMNPGGANTVTVNPAWFVTSSNPGTNPNTQDYDGGSVGNIRITSMPTNATSISINGTKYGPGCPGCIPWPGTDVVIPYSTGTGPTQTILLDPVDGVVTSNINFAARDNRTAEDLSPGSVSLVFNATLPITLESFKAHLQADNTMLLKWEVSEEININGYEILFSADGVHFNSVGNQPAKNQQKYQFVHALNSAGPVLYYQLRTNENDGTYTFSNVLSVNRNNRVLFSAKVYPNPAKDHVMIVLNNSAKTTVSVTNIHGRVISNNTFNKEVNRVSLVGLEAGVYYISIVNREGEKIIKKIILQ